MVVYHGAESIIPFSASKEQARLRFSLPQEGRIVTSRRIQNSDERMGCIRKNAHT